MVLAVGSVTLPSRVFLAPMSGVTDWPFRKLVCELGARLVVSEMIASESMIRHTRQSLRMAKPAASKNGPTIIQLAGTKPEIMSEAAKLAVDAGADIVDINMGCPAKKIVNHYAGSALMKDLENARAILRAVVKAVRVPVTLKMRKGWDEYTQNAPELAHIAESEGIQMITIHGRTRCQFYRGISDWKFFRCVKQRVKIPLIGNGDIRTPQEAKTVMAEHGTDGIMLGRACYGKPWLIPQVHTFLETGQESRPPEPSMQAHIVERHLEDMLHFYGHQAGVRIARKHLGWYSKGYRAGANFRAQVNQTEDAQALKGLVKDFYAQHCEGTPHAIC